MSGAADALRGIGAMAARDLRIFLSYRWRPVSLLLTVLFTITLFHYLGRLVHAPGLEAPGRYYAFVVVGLVILEVLTSTLVLPPVTARTELVAGTFERVVSAPAGGAACLCGLMAFPLLLAVVSAVVTLALAGLLYGLHLHWATVPLAVPLAALGALSFAPFGMLLLAAALTLKQTVAGATFIVSGISLVAGVYFPVSVLPGWLQWMGDLQPFTPAVSLLRHALVGTPTLDPAGLEVLQLAGFAAVGIPVGALALAGALEFGRRRGTLLEY